MRSLLLLILAVLMTGCAGTCKVVGGAASSKMLATQAAVADSIIVKFKEQRVQLQAESTQQMASVRRLGLAFVRPMGAGAAVFRITAQKGRDVRSVMDAVLQDLRSDPEVEYAEPNYRMHAFAATNDTCWQERHLWAFRNHGTGPDESLGGISAVRAWDRGAGTHEVVVAVIDTGLVASHYDKHPANVLVGYNVMEKSSDVDDRGTSHGTHVAGTIGFLAANNEDGSVSLNHRVGILPVRVLGDDGSGTLDGVVTGILWAVGEPQPGIPTNPRPAKVLNLSLGAFQPCSATRSLQDAIHVARRRGAVVVVAAGNWASDAADFTPASCVGAFTVAASGPDGELSFYSNHGSRVNVLAPGGNDATDSDPARTILSSVKGGFGWMQGTSMAAPHVAGVFALLAARYPTLSNAELEAKLGSALIPLRSGQCSRPCGRGFLNADIP